MQRISVRRRLERHERGELRAKRLSRGDEPAGRADYYYDAHHSEYWIVECGGDMDEDACDSKITCTRMRLVKQISLETLIAAGLIYAYRNQMAGRYQEKASSKGCGYVIAKGAEPKCSGRKGEVLGYIKTDGSGTVLDVCIVTVDGERILPGRMYSWTDLHGEEATK